MTCAESKKRYTELVFILDRSGSMSGLENDTIGGYNSLIEQQKQKEGECRLTTVLFDNRYELLHDRAYLYDVIPMTAKEYWVRGTTALFDAIGKTIQHIRAEQKRADETERADKVLFVITTDGMENASREYSLESVRRLIEDAKEELGWEFLFLGANIDAIETASRFGISASRAVNYHADSRGTRINYSIISDTISYMRDYGGIEDCWKDDIEEYYFDHDTSSFSNDDDDDSMLGMDNDDEQIIDCEGDALFL